MGSDVTKIVTCVAFRVMGKRGVGGRSVKNKTGTGIGGEGEEGNTQSPDRRKIKWRTEVILDRNKSYTEVIFG